VRCVQELSINQDTFDAEAAPAQDEEMGLATNPALSEAAPDVKSSVSFTHTELRKPQSYSTHHSSVTRNAKVKRPAKHTEGAGLAAKVPDSSCVVCRVSCAVLLTGARGRAR
jgi:hypothetical protein